MATTGQCAQCGTSLAPEALAGLCPKCLAALAFAPDEAADPGAPRGGEPPRSRLRYFGDYELIEEIARGGMGVVFKARQVSLNRIVAVKMLLSGPFSSEDFVKRFRTEAEAAAGLQHPNIVAIHEVGEHEGQQYFSMDFVDGQSLAQRARESPLPPELAVDYMRTIAEAIHYAHQRGILHRDLKPSNVLIDPLDRPRVTDFGLAKRLTDSEFGHRDPGLTVTGQVLGTPNYISPEQASGRRGEVTVASDVYGLGAILYFLFTGRPPVLAATMEGVLEQVLRHEPAPPRQLNPALPRDLETICLKCLSKEPSRRYATALEVAADLDRFRRGEPITARPVSLPEKAWRWCRRKPALAAVILALHLVGAAGLAGILWQWRRAEANASAARDQSERAEQHAALESAMRQRAEQAVTMLELQRAEDLLEKDEITLGVACLARVVRQQPTNAIAARRLLSALAQRSFALPTGPRLPHAASVKHVELGPDGRRLATAGDLAARVWDARTGQLLVGPLLHAGTVRLARFSPDGGRLLTVADGVGARVWALATGRPLGQPMPHANKIPTAEFSPDGQRVLTVPEDNTARLWNAHTGEPLFSPFRHEAPVRWARFNREGTLLVTASDDKTAQVWNATNGQPVSPPIRHKAGVEIAEFSPNGQWVVTAARDHSTCVWNAASGEPLVKPFIHPARIASVRFSPEGQRVVVSLHDRLTRIFQARDWTPIGAPMAHGAWTPVAEFSPDGASILTASLDSTARLWNAATGEPVTEPMQHDGLVWTAALSPDGRLAATGSADGTARIWDVRPGAPRRLRMPMGSPVRVAKFSPDGEWVVLRSDTGPARLWKVRTGQPQEFELHHRQGIIELHFSPDGRSLATTSVDGTARVWSVDTGQPLTPLLQHGMPVNRLQFSPDGQVLATASHHAAKVWLWNGATGQLIAEPLANQSPARALAFSPDGRLLLASRFDDNGVNVWDVTSRSVVAELVGHTGYVLECEFSPDGQRVLTASEDGTARLWDAHTGRLLAEPLRHRAVLRDARFSHNGQWVVTASEDSTAQVWEADTGQPIGEPLRHQGRVNHAEFSPDGTLVLTAAEDGTARLWDARTGQPVTEPFRHEGRVESAHFSPDGRRILTACQAGAAHLWDVPPPIRSADLEFAEPVVQPREGARLQHASPLTPALSPLRGEGEPPERFGRAAPAPVGASSKHLRAGVAPGAAGTSNAPVASPSPLNGERAGVRGENSRQLSTPAITPALSPTLDPQAVGSAKHLGAGATSAGGKPVREQPESLLHQDAATLLADLAEAVIGKRVNERGALENLPDAGLAELRRRVAALPRESDFTRWLEWFLADRDTRPDSPYSLPKPASK
jgi:WD40 repeat protein/aminoglycoside phosphotransferase (APT) family kinase protein